MDREVETPLRTDEAPERVAIRVACILALVAAYVVATTYPFERRANGASIGDQNGAGFESPGIVRWTGEPFWLAPGGTGALVFSIDARPFRSHQTGPARLLTISRDHHHANFTIGHAADDLVIRLRRAGSDPLGLPPFTIDGVFARSGFRSIDVELSDEAIAVRIDDALVLDAPLVKSPFPSWNRDYRLALGNEWTWQRPWLGRIRSASVRTDRGSIDLLDTRSIDLPGYGHLFTRKFRVVTESPIDAVLNFVPMLPVGVVTRRLLPRVRLAAVLGLWGTVALSVEALQTVIVGRHPSLSDWVLNLAGVGVGIWIASRPPRAPRG